MVITRMEYGRDSCGRPTFFEISDETAENFEDNICSLQHKQEVRIHSILCYKGMQTSSQQPSCRNSPGGSHFISNTKNSPAQLRKGTLLYKPLGKANKQPNSLMFADFV